MLDAVSTMFGVMRLGNIEHNPVVHQLISDYGIWGTVIYLPLEAAFFASIPFIFLVLLDKPWDRFDKFLIIFIGGLWLSFPFQQAVFNLLFIFLRIG